MVLKPFSSKPHYFFGQWYYKPLHYNTPKVEGEAQYRKPGFRNGYQHFCPKITFHVVSFHIFLLSDFLKFKSMHMLRSLKVNSGVSFKNTLFKLPALSFKCSELQKYLFYRFTHKGWDFRDDCAELLLLCYNHDFLQLLTCAFK